MLTTTKSHKQNHACTKHANMQQTQTSSSAMAESHRATHALLSLAKLRSVIFEPPFGELTGKVGVSSTESTCSTIIPLSNGP